jgi:hypothetical protein
VLYTNMSTSGGIKLGQSNVPVQVIESAVATGTELDVEFWLKWTQYQWMNAQSQLNTIPCDSAPIVSKVLLQNLHSGLTTLEIDYKPNGIHVVYHIRPSVQNYPHNDFIKNTLGHNGDVRPVDTIKMFCFTKSPPTIGTQLTHSKNDAEVTTETKNSLHCFLASNFIKIDELATCLRGGDNTPLVKPFLHNFTPQGIMFEISDAVVHINGIRCVSGEHLCKTLDIERNSGRMRTSLMHSMEQRSEVINTNMQLFGKGVLNSCSVRNNSIGSMMGNPVSMGQMHKESLPMYMMGNMYKADFGSISPELAVHFAAHAHNITATTPHNSNLGVPLFKIYARARIMTTSQLMNLIHTCYQGPCFSAELTPYTSDRVLNIGPETVTELTNGTFKGVWRNKDFLLTECIDNAFSQPNDTHIFRANDCEGSAAMLVTMQNNLRSVFYESTKYLSNCHTPGGQQALSDWLGRCNVNLPTNMHYAFAVQLTALSAVAHMASDLKTLIVGAQCATPLQAPGDPSKPENRGLQEPPPPHEEGHCACLLQANRTSIGNITQQVYDHFGTEANCGVMLTMPSPDAPNRNQSTTNGVPTKNSTNNFKTKSLLKMSLQPSTISSKTISEGYHALWPALASDFPHHDVAQNSEFFMVESTTALHWCPVRGHISSAKMQGMVASKGAQTPGPMKSIPIEMFAQEWMLKDLRPYISCTEDVRLQGFMHAPKDGTTATPFYKTFYVMDGFVLHEINADGGLQVGSDATKLLNNIKDPGTKLVLEKIQLPCLTASENEQLSNEMYAQWNETRLPTMTRDVVCKNLASWHPATINSNHAPENGHDGILRCNISISGRGATELHNDMSPGGTRALQFAADDYGIVADMRVIAMGKNTTILSQSIRVNHLLEKTVHTVTVQNGVSM